MGQLTLQSLIGEVRAGLGNRQDITDQVIVDSLNIAQSQLSRAYPFHELRRTARAVNSLTANAAVDKYLRLPARLKAIHTIICQNGLSSNKLVQKPWRMLDKLFPSPESASRAQPNLYAKWGELLILIPVPNIQYFFYMKYTGDPTAFVVTNAAQLSDFDYKDDILIDLALVRRLRAIGRHDKADEHLKNAKLATDMAIEQEDSEPDMDTSQLDDASIFGPYWINPFVRGIGP
jgi:hypothetical protein